MNPEKGQFYLERLKEITLSESDDAIKSNILLALINQIFHEFIEIEGIQLSSLFSKIAFIGNKHELNKRVIYATHTLRIASETQNIKAYFSNINQAFSVIHLLIGELFNTYIDPHQKKVFNEWMQNREQSSTIQFFREMEVIALNGTDKYLTVISNTEPYEEYKMLYNDIGKNDFFKKEIHYLISNNKLPITLYLHDTSLKEGNTLSPSIIVINPSYLFDVTLVSENFKATGVDTRYALLRQYLPQQSSKYLMIGNIVNGVLDRLIANPTLVFEDFLEELFKFDPLGFTVFDNTVIREIIDKIKIHFRILKNIVNHDFAKHSIRKETSFLEPSFYSPKYGLQGRLDLLNYSDEENQVDIVELKSGKAFRPNAYGLGNNHYVQTLLYELLIQSSLGSTHRVNNYILYSGEKERHLRFAPSIKQQQKEAIKARNALLTQQYKVEDAVYEDENIFDSIAVDKFDKIYGFDLDNVKSFERVYQGLNDMERAYFNEFSAFITREKRLSKIGNSNQERKRGLALLWENNIEEKKSNYSILNHLKLEATTNDLALPLMRFSKSIETIRLANFRVGDIVIAYPIVDHDKSPTDSQLIKGTLISISDKEVVMRLRNAQFHASHFETTEYWHIESDVLDSGYTQMFRGIFEWASSIKSIRNKILGLSSPRQYDIIPLQLDDPILTGEQVSIIQKIVQAKDYYLLWGPPGTGKTSVVIKNVVKFLNENTNENILLLAYTNRAVDEICKAISNIKKDFIRIGSRYACAEEFVPNLLSNKVANAKNRNEIKEMLFATRIVISTVSSAISKIELFALKQFDRIIVDEASQLLEPYLVGLMSRCEKITLIGDHKQLPAVVQQSEQESAFINSDLLKKGYENMRYSLFERLLKQAKKNNWTWAFGQLSYQGRMNEELMAFPSDNFYNSSLKILPNIARLSRRSLWNEKHDNDLLNHRKIFINSIPNSYGENNKINESEAIIVVDTVKQILDFHVKNNIAITKNTIGIITPYRAQIAMITEKFYEAGIDISNISIDTVERYQGGARDIIILSFCINKVSQFQNLMSLSADGVDRKLNVAITRSKEQLILVGAKEILKENPLYWALVQSSFELEKRS